MAKRLLENILILNILSLASFSNKNSIVDLISKSNLK